MLNDYIKTIFKAQQKAEQPKEQPSTTDVSDLESKESAAPRKSETEKVSKYLHRIKLSLYSLLSWHKYKPKITHRNSKMKSENY